MIEFLTNLGDHRCGLECDHREHCRSEVHRQNEVQPDG